MGAAVEVSQTDCASIQKPSASAMDIAGPASAIQNSSRAEDGSAPSSAIPPKINKVMLLIGTPRCRATTEWASSCSKRHENRPNIATSAMIRWVALVVSGKIFGK